MRYYTPLWLFVMVVLVAVLTLISFGSPLWLICVITLPLCVHLMLHNYTYVRDAKTAIANIDDTLNYLYYYKDDSNLMNRTAALTELLVQRQRIASTLAGTAFADNTYPELDISKIPLYKAYPLSMKKDIPNIPKEFWE